MAKLSVIIVNYNVAYFLEQCLRSVQEASTGLDTEIFVVDNHSVDNSLEMLRKEFPEVKLIANEENVGFAKANNQAIRQASGEYILLLNPDTLVESDTFVKTIAFMDETADAGALGVKMIDGRGRYLPESKRGLPLPDVAFYKIFGLSKLFKKSKRFGRYHLTYLDPDEIHSIEVLPGAFMLLRKSVLDKIGLLDESFFMYGEDIDLSYRVILGGYKNYYYPHTRIIHYKGESTKKSSINYVVVFYQAMQIFAKKHFSPKNARIFDFIINAAIWFRASLAICKRLFLRILMPLLDFLFIYGGLFLISNYWESHVLAARGTAFPEEYRLLVLPFYALVWLFCIWLQKGYRTPVSFKKLNQGLVLGAVVILLIYALLGEQLRFSRAVILIGVAYVFVVLNLMRLIIGRLKLKNYPIGDMLVKRLLIVGKEEETSRVAQLLPMMSLRQVLVGFVHPDKTEEKKPRYIGNLSDIRDMIEIYKINALIFCGADVPAKQIITVMSQLQDFSLEYKIAPPKSMYIIGSNSINVEGDIYTLSANSIGKKENVRRKRCLDIVVSLFLWLLSPVLVWFMSGKRIFFERIREVFSGKKSWVGYERSEMSEKDMLPPLKEGVLTVASAWENGIKKELIPQLNGLYAKDYKIRTDLQIIIKNLLKIGQL